MSARTAQHRLCRRVGFSVCGLQNCPAVARPYPPGQHGPRLRHRPSNYETRLLEKQKLKSIYQLSERQLRRYFENAARQRGVTGDVLLRALESRLDSIVLRLGFAKTMREARRLVSHGHVWVDGRRVNIPSATVHRGQQIAFAGDARNSPLLRERLEEAGPIPPYLEREVGVGSGRMLRLPERDEIPLPVPINDLLIVEYYA